MMLAIEQTAQQWIDDELATRLPSHPDNASQQLVINTEWYAKWEQIASEKYQAMLTE